MRLVILVTIGVLIVAIVLGTIFYLGKIFQSRSRGTNNSILSTLPIATPSGTLSIPSGAQSFGQTVPAADMKTYQGSGFTLKYPKNWGLLTCNNSRNIELDPINGQDIKNVICDYAVKPITILAGNHLVCQGESVTLGTNKVIKSKSIGQNGDISYHWCVNIGNQGLDISHRVSSSGDRATSKIDFSTQIEQVISTINTSGTGGS